ncbi:uncharacterized protein isoform X3 [Castor canadensis]|uniref:Uncharacterized protein isoform X3 n=1 Tax=Castor canadensis TaxID=51338 RepID=A0AC58LC23_CASCN
MSGESWILLREAYTGILREACMLENYRHLATLARSSLEGREGKAWRLCFWRPENASTKVGFITFGNRIHFCSFQEGLSQLQMLMVSDIEEISGESRKEAAYKQLAPDNCPGLMYWGLNSGPIP